MRNQGEQLGRANLCIYNSKLAWGHPNKAMWVRKSHSIRVWIHGLSSWLAMRWDLGEIDWAFIEASGSSIDDYCFPFWKVRFQEASASAFVTTLSAIQVVQRTGIRPCPRIINICPPIVLIQVMMLIVFSTKKELVIEIALIPLFGRSGRVPSFREMPSLQLSQVTP